MDIRQRKLFKDYPEFKELFIVVVALQKTIEASELAPLFETSLTKTKNYFQFAENLPDAEL